jgi:hypothetical protein
MPNTAQPNPSDVAKGHPNFKEIFEFARHNGTGVLKTDRSLPEVTQEMKKLPVDKLKKHAELLTWLHNHIHSKDVPMPKEETDPKAQYLEMISDFYLNTDWELVKTWFPFGGSSFVDYKSNSGSIISGRASKEQSRFDSGAGSGAGSGSGPGSGYSYSSYSGV